MKGESSGLSLQPKKSRFKQKAAKEEPTEDDDPGHISTMNSYENPATKVQPCVCDHVEAIMYARRM